MVPLWFMSSEIPPSIRQHLLNKCHQDVECFTENKSAKNNNFIQQSSSSSSTDMNLGKLDIQNNLKRKRLYAGSASNTNVNGKSQTF